MPTENSGNSSDYIETFTVARALTEKIGVWERTEREKLPSQIFEAWNFGLLEKDQLGKSYHCQYS